LSLKQIEIFTKKQSAIPDIYDLVHDEIYSNFQLNAMHWRIEEATSTELRLLDLSILPRMAIFRSLDPLDNGCEPTFSLEFQSLFPIRFNKFGLLFRYLKIVSFSFLLDNILCWISYCFGRFRSRICRSGMSPWIV